MNLNRPPPTKVPRRPRSLPAELLRKVHGGTEPNNPPPRLIGPKDRVPPGGDDGGGGT